MAPAPVLTNNCSNVSPELSPMALTTAARLEHDPDIDVQYYAQRALLLCVATKTLNQR